MDDILAPIQDAFEGQIVSAQFPLAYFIVAVPDFRGQQITEILSTTLLVLSGVIAFLVGYIFQDLHLTLWTGLAGTALTGFVVIPPWPFYNKQPENWLIPLPGGAGGPGVMVDGVKVA
ncbi:microsomal signal peptidase 12 kDa subunit-domain-containing protein [Aspergillus pseudoustus]|uniref:Signal peptidase complex subunit 1 n=1 Tax=Aspergillus pseudoustus TaxID=1810923 RepID=A0ABR4K9J7_9EURO